MSVFTALTRITPEIDGVRFDATLESTLTASVETTTYPLESGINVADHTLILPLEYTMTIVASNNPLQPGITDVIGGAVSNFVPGFAGAAGAFSGLLSSSKETHGAMVLQTLISKMIDRKPITITDGDITLSSMLITSVTRTRTPENEGGLEAEITMQELPLIDRIQADGFGTGDMAINDPSKNRAGGVVAGGQAAMKTAGEKVRNASKNVFSKAIGGV